MSLENANYISQLVLTNPTPTDPKSQGDDHLRLIKKATQQSFPNVDGPVILTPDQFNALPGQVAAIPAPSNANPIAIGNAAPGTSGLFSRSDHVHGPQTSNYYSGQVLQAFSSNDVGGNCNGSSYIPVTGTISFTPRSAASILMIDCSFDMASAYIAANNTQTIFQFFKNAVGIGPEHIVMIAGNTGGYSFTGRQHIRFRIAPGSIAQIGFYLAARLANAGTQSTISNVEWLFMEIA